MVGARARLTNGRGRCHANAIRLSQGQSNTLMARLLSIAR